jgi:Cu(I)/Ag(I) efflux system membrane protein CusA/SilA
MIKSENGILCAYVQLNVHGRDLRGFVEDAQARVASKIALPPGVFLQWGGQFEHEVSARRTLALVFPLVILLIFLILFWTYRDLGDAILMMLAVPGALVGGLLCQRLMGFQFSVAVWVGYIACFGLATETGIVMLVYLREAIDRRGGLSALRSIDELRAAVAAGAIQRLRPKLLTEGLIVLSLLPMLWSSGAGAEILRPMAAPVLGGILIADEVIDVTIPVLFFWLRKRRWLRLAREQVADLPRTPDDEGLSGRARRRLRG